MCSGATVASMQASKDGPVDQQEGNIVSDGKEEAKKVKSEKERMEPS